MVGIAIINLVLMAFWLHVINYLQIPWVTIGSHLMHLFSNQRVKRSITKEKKSAYFSLYHAKVITSSMVATEQSRLVHSASSFQNGHSFQRSAYGYDALNIQTSATNERIKLTL